VLQQEVVEERPWHAPATPLAHLFVDARGAPARCAAVLLIDGQRLYTDGKPSDELMSAFSQRADNQIMTLEILAISVGLSTFAAELCGRKVVVWSDNRGAEVSSLHCSPLGTLTQMCVCVFLQEASRSGRAKCVDHCGLIHEIWTHCFLNKTYLWIERVPSAENLSDLPSREDYRLLEELNFTWRPPVVATHGFDLNR